MYALGQGNCFLPLLTKKQKNISSRIKKQFPLVTFCCWHTSALKEFFQHFAVYDFLLIETERETIDAVFHFIKETNKNTFKEPSRDMMENLVFDGKDAVIVKSLITEAPLQEVDAVTVPAIEKIIVDLVADSETFFFLQGHEMLNVFESAMGKYTVNTDRLLRYAKRRTTKDTDANKRQKQVNSAGNLAKLIETCEKNFVRFENAEQVISWNIQEPLDTRLNKLRKTNPEAFFNWYQFYLLSGKAGEE